jgi:hypothetical protein
LLVASKPKRGALSAPNYRKMRLGKKAQVRVHDGLFALNLACWKLVIVGSGCAIRAVQPRLEFADDGAENAGGKQAGTERA